MATDEVRNLLAHVIKMIDRWWVKMSDGDRGCFIRSNIPCVVYGYYVEWRYSKTRDSRDYVSIIISLKYEGDVDYIRIALRKMKNEVYTEYDPFCEIHDGKVDVTISDGTGGYDEWFDIFGKGCFNDLTDDIATTVYGFTNPSSDEEEVGVNMNEVSKTLTVPAGLMTKEIFVLDTSYFMIGDIYLLEIDPKYDWSKISTTPIKVPRWVYAICEDVCSTVIDFMLGGIDGRDQLFRMQVHADEIESGLITVKRVLMNETLIQTEDEGCCRE